MSGYGRQSGGKEASMLTDPRISEGAGNKVQPSSTAQWLAEKTQSIFGKSKSCTDLKEIDRLLSPQMEVK